jgi:CHAT domain-containing protein/tetratricopeptide (TPR) repeat protein
VNAAAGCNYAAEWNFWARCGILRGMGSRRIFIAIAGARLTWGLVSWGVVCWGSPDVGALAQEAAVEAAVTGAGPRHAEREQMADEAIGLAEAGKFAEAIAVGERLLAVERESLPADHADNLGTLQWLASTHAEAEEWDRAEARWREAVAWIEQHAATDEALLAATQIEFGDTLVAAGKVDEGIALVQSLVPTLKKLGRPLDVAIALDALASALIAAERHEEAARAYAECLTILEGIEHDQDLSLTHQGYGSTLYLLDRNDEAIVQFQRAAELFAAHDDPVQAAWQYDWIGACHRDAERDGDAVDAYRECLARFAKLEHTEDLADTHQELGKALLRLERYDEAIAEFNAARVVHEKLERAADAAWTFDWIGLAQRRADRHKEAAAAYAECLARFATLTEQAAPLNEKPDLAETHDLYGKTLKSLRRFDEAVAQFRAAAAAYAAKGNKVNEAWMSFWIGACATDQSKYDDAAKLYESTLAEFEALGDKVATAELLHHIGGRYELAADYAKARELMERSLEMRRRLLGERHSETIVSANDLAKLLYVMGSYDEALALFEQVVVSSQEAFGEKSSRYALALNNLGEAKSTLGRYREAELNLRAASEIWRETPGELSEPYATSCNNLAKLYSVMGDLDRAEELHLQALEIRKQIHGEESLDYGLSLANLAVVYNAKSENAAAADYGLRAVSVLRQLVGDSDPQYLTCVSNLATVYSDQGLYQKAEPLLIHVNGVRKRTLGATHPHYAMSANNLANLYHVLGEFEHALPLSKEAVAAFKESLGEQHIDYATALNNLAALHESMGETARAEKLYLESIARASRLVEAAALGLDERGQLAYGQSVRHFLDSYLSMKLEADDAADRAYALVLGWKGATLLRQRAARMATDDPAVANVLAELRSAAREWSTLAAAAGSDAAAKSQLASLELRKKELEIELNARSAEFRAAAAPATVDGMRAAIPADAALVDFIEYTRSRAVDQSATGGPKNKIVFERSLAAFVVRAGSGVQRFDLGLAVPIDEAIDRWRAGFGGASDSKEAGQLLRERLWTPLAGAIGDAKLVLVSPDGAIGKLPLAALPGTKAETYLIEDVAIAIVPVPQLLPAMVAKRELKRLPKDLLVVGGVDYDRRSAKAAGGALAAKPAAPWERGLGRLISEQALGERAIEQQAITGEFSWNFLPGTESEAAYVANAYRREMKLPVGSERIVDLRGSEATEEAFRAAAAECYLLHLATHGFFAADEEAAAGAGGAAAIAAQRDNPFGERLAQVRGHSPGLLSGLVLAGANQPPEIPADPAQLAAMPDDGYLTADEIAQLPLTSAQLVVMSACESGLGEAAGGEGLLGIQRAFQVAGARSSIATLWKVNDEATRRIMEEFYRGYLQEAKSPLEALRAAQRWALNNPDLVPRGVAPPAGRGTASKRLPPRYWAAFTLSGDWR